MAIQRVFLGWDRPPLASAISFLVERFGSRETLDLARVILVVPGGRVGRRLQEMLVESAETRGLLLRPPKLVSVGQLPEKLYPAQRPFAGDLVQQLAWVRALGQAEPQQLKLLSASVPATDDLPGWLALGAMLGRLHRELAAEALDFHKVAEHGAALEGFCEEPRWRMLAAVQDRYLAVLDGLDLWDRQTARLYAIEHRECRTEDPIVLVGTADMNRVQQKMLDQVAGQVTALVFAPEKLADRFDAHGCLRPEAWQEVSIDLADRQIEIAGGPAEQAAAAIRAIGDLEGRYAADQITIGVPDERLVPYLQQQLEAWDLPARYGPGTPIVQTEPYRLLAAVADYLEAGDFRTLAVLVRHPAVTDWLAAQKAHADWLTLLDRYWSEHLPHQLGRPWLGNSESGRQLQDLTAEVGRLMHALSGPRRRLDEWCEPILGLLVQVFGEAERDPGNPADRGVLTACRQLCDVLGEDLRIPAELMPEVPAGEALGLVLQQAAGERIAPLPNPKAIELLGWLELPLDDAPALVVVAVNEGIVPSSLNADLFLPNQLRRVLGIEDNARRYARDAYAMSVLCGSRERLRLIAGRRTSDGDPLVPSRLLFACDGPSMARRASAYFAAGAEGGSAGSAPASAAVSPGGHAGESERDTAGQASSGTQVPTGTKAGMVTRANGKAGVAAGANGSRSLDVPRPRPLAEPVTSMRVTEFRDYLACPYRYYLRHRLRLERLADDAEELDGLGFGALIHEVLRRFGAGPLTASTDAHVIGDFLGQSLDEAIRESYGSQPLPAIRVQAEQLRTRLSAFAAWQAGRAAEGWQIEHVEWQPEEDQARLMVDGRPMFLRGRIDRVDFHPAKGQRMIFDYKSSNQADSPEKTHRRQGQWVDLQLPLYRHLAAALGLDGPIGLAYIALPKDVRQVGMLPAAWTADDLAEADLAAAEVVRKVRAEQFWPPVSPPPAFFDDLAAICQDNQLIARIEATAGEEEDET